MTLKTFVLPVGFGCALLGTALGLGVSCGSSKTSADAGPNDAAAEVEPTDVASTETAPGPTNIVISGVASPFPGDPESDFTSLALAIADPLDVLAHKPALATMAPFDTSAAVCPGEGCLAPYSFPAVLVNPSTSIIGLLAIFQDLRPIVSDGGVAAKWVRTGTGIANADQLTAAAFSGSLTGRPVYAISTAFEAKLSQFAAAVGGADAGVAGTPGELAGKGFVLAMILANGSPKPTPVEGATFSPPAGANGKFTVLYPNATFTGVGTATSATGLVLIYPNVPAVQAPVAPWSVTPPSGSTTTWPTQVVGVQADGAVVLLDVSN